ncbi:hypothetical protein B7P43_G15177 [Cryptotermes secundus]|uniref:PHD-type domain-containing protein n=1 Tax=Cryptotermes secundus TaxID=105785 RepID=A0A2J7PMN1_9NEOP|nr:hypothetical protein B7P43_G15177 [Cryptotermes secundus]
MGCYLEDYRARVGNWAARTPWRHAQGREVNGQARSYIGNMLLCAAALAIVLVIGGVEQNPGPVVEAENILQVLCSGCERNLKSGTQCDTCGRWFHNSCGNVRAQMAESGKWSCERCRWGRLRQLEEKLENAMKQIEELKRKNSALEDQLRGAVARGDTVQRQQDAECLVLGDSIICNVEAEMRVQCFPGIRTEQLQRVIDNRDLGAPDTVIIHVGTNDLRRTGNLDYVMGDVYASPVASYSTPLTISDNQNLRTNETILDRLASTPHSDKESLTSCTVNGNIKVGNRSILKTRTSSRIKKAPVTKKIFYGKVNL